MRRFILLSSSLALALALAIPAPAAQSATVVLRSGERVTGELVDMGAGGFSVRVGGTMRRIPTGDVAVIDFGDGSTFPSNEVSKVTGGQHLVVLSSGQTVTGRLFDIGGNVPLRLSVDTASGKREFSSNEVRRIYLAPPPAASRGGGVGVTPSAGGPPTPLPPTGGQIRVPANQRWVDTGLTVRRGDRIAFNASGRVQLSANANDTAGPAGAENGRRPTGPMPALLAGALIGRIGPVSMFAIGNQTTQLPMPADGRLFLGVNDDELSDNRGEFVVDVRPATPLNQRRR
jgi:hypothetical protein